MLFGVCRRVASEAVGKPLPCRLGWHKWVVKRTADNKRFRQCARCRKDDDGSYDGMSFTAGGGV